MDSIPYLNELMALNFIAIFMAISPGADFVMITRNSILYGRKSGLLSAIGVSIAIWVHVAYSIFGIAVIISNSIILFSIIKYFGAIYLIYLGWKTFTSKSMTDIKEEDISSSITSFQFFKLGFITNVLNPKTSLFFLSIFTQFVTVNTPIWMQLVYGLIISMAHLIWFICVSYLFTHPILLEEFYKSKKMIEKIVGILLIGLGLKVAVASNN